MHVARIVSLTVVLGFALSAANGQTTLHVRGADAVAAGTAEAPTGLRNALEKAAGDVGITEIILTEGEYPGSYTLANVKDVDPATLPRLTLRAQKGHNVVLRNSVRLDNTEAVAGRTGLFRTRTIPPSDPEMWERDTRVRYFTLATRDSVAAHPGSCFVDRTEGWLYFSTSDGKAPGEHEVRLSLSPKNSRALAVYRHNVTIDGIGFADHINTNALAIQSYGSNLIIRNCRFDNCETAWGTDPRSDAGLMENCVAIDVARGVFSNSNHITVRDCRFEKTRDRFLYDLYPQNDCAYQVYSPGKGGTIIGNFAKGYHLGIFIKAGNAPYIIRHNTIVDAHQAIGFSYPIPDSDVSYNITVDAKSFVHLAGFKPNLTCDYNLFWQPRELSELATRTEVLRGAGRGKFNLLADPRFVDAARGDYRLLPDSPAVFLRDSDGRPAGAFEVATPDDAKNAAPTLSLDFAADSRPFGRTGDYTFDRDPWIGGGTTHVRALTDAGLPRRLTGLTTIAVHPRAFDVLGTVPRLRVRVDDGETQLVDFIDKHELALPDKDGEHRIRYEAQNDRGVWSAPAEAIVRIDRKPPVMVGEPRVHANDHGLIVEVRTDEPCLAELHYGESPAALSAKVKTPAFVTRFWDANDGGEWVETWNVPRTQHALALLSPNVSKGQTVYARLVLTDEAGLTTQSEPFSMIVQGETKTIVAGPAESDLSLQQAVDIALPGDRVVLKPGVYTEYTLLTHGGVSDAARITIEPEKPGTVTLDGAKKHNALIHLESAPYVTIRDVRVLYFKKAGIYAYRSPHTTIENCRFWNGPGWATGYHTFMFYSPGGIVTRCVAIGAEIGFYFLKSEAATVTHNTASQHMYAAAEYAYSMKNTVQMYNSFAFAGNDIYSGYTTHPDDLKSFKSDHNNLGTNVTDYNREYESRQPELWKQMKAEEYPRPKYEQYIQTGSKAIVNVDKRYLTLKQWRDETGQDMHSIFADPMYVRPWEPIDSWDWGVKTGSPNLSLKDENGSPIGALGGAE